MAVVSEHPYGQYNFLVDLGDGEDATPHGGFSEVSGLDVSIDVVEYRAGNSKVPTPIKLNGLTRYGDVTLKRGVMGTLLLWEWIEASRNGVADARRTVSIRLLDEERQVVLTWRLANARPIRHTSGPLRGGGSDVAVEELVLAHEGLDIE